MPKRPAGKKAASTSAPLATPETPIAGDTSESDLHPPVTTNDPPTEDEVITTPAPPPPDPLTQVDDGWDRGKKEVYLLENGATLIARNEVEAGAYANKGGKLVDVIYDE